MIRIGFKQGIMHQGIRKHEAFPLQPFLFGRHYTTQNNESQVTELANRALFKGESKTIGSYPNLFTQEGEEMILHPPHLGGTPAEKRLEFIRLYLHGNGLIGKESVSLKELTEMANEKGFRSEKGKKTETGNLYKSLLKSKSNHKQFKAFKDDEGRTHIGLTDLGKQIALNRAEILNGIEPNIPSGRTRDLLILFKEKNWIDKTLKLKHIGEGCRESGYIVEQGNLQKLLKRSYQFFILHSKTHRVSLSRIGKSIAKQL